MKIETATHYAAKIHAWLLPHADHLQIAGSIRRERPVCNDVDVVVIPKIEHSLDLLGEVSTRRNRVLEFLQEYVRLATREEGSRPKFVSGGEREGKSIILDLRKCQLDLWFADERTLATRLLCRTGSREHNIWLASRAKRQGRKWNPYEGVLTGGQWRRIGDAEEYMGGQLQPAASEAEVYALLDLPFIDPRDREIQILNERFGA